MSRLLVNPNTVKAIGDVCFTYVTLRDAKRTSGHDITPIALQEARKRFHEFVTPELVLELLEYVDGKQS